MSYEKKLTLWLFKTFYPTISKEVVIRKVLPHAEELTDYYFQLARNLGLGEYLYRGIKIEELEKMGQRIRKDKINTERYPLLWWRRYNETIKEHMVKYLTR